MGEHAKHKPGFFYHKIKLVFRLVLWESIIFYLKIKLVFRLVLWESMLNTSQGEETRRLSRGSLNGM